MTPVLSVLRVPRAGTVAPPKCAPGVRRRATPSRNGPRRTEAAAGPGAWAAYAWRSAWLLGEGVPIAKDFFFCNRNRPGGADPRRVALSQNLVAFQAAGEPGSQGVALGWRLAAFQAAIQVGPEGAQASSPGQRPGSS